jgi:hypothetical protein
VTKNTEEDQKEAEGRQQKKYVSVFVALARSFFTCASLGFATLPIGGLRELEDEVTHLARSEAVWEFV